MFKKVLLQTDLTPSQAEILEYLYQNKEGKASEIAKTIKRSRAIVYKELEELSKLGVVEKIEKPNKVTVFCASHPSNLNKLIEKKEAQLKKDKELLNNYLPDIISSFNLINNKPGIRLYEGEDGIKKVLEDSLTAKSTIRTYVDIESIVKYMDEINKEYVKKRERLGIKKMGLILESDFAKEYLKNYYSAVTDTKILKKEFVEFKAIMQIYDNKISYITLSPENKIGVIIEDPNIYLMHKTLFDFNWQSAEDLKNYLAN